MRAAPAVHVLVNRFAVWRGAVWCAGSVGVSVALAWSSGHVLTRGWSAAGWIAASGFMAAAASLWLATRLSSMRAFELRWDGRAWQLSRPAAPAADPIAGDVQVAVDLGSWLLLRFESEWPPERPRRYWLPLQRRGGLEAAWHGLRCALYSPRRSSSAADPDAAR